MLVASFFVFLAAGDGVARQRAHGSTGPSVWSSALECELAPRAARGAGAVRVASWNVRWFPDGTFRDELHPEHRSDVSWLACSLASLSVDVIAVQEFKKHARATRATEALLAALDERTGGRWRIQLDDCPHENQPHIGFLFDAARVDALGFEPLTELNPHGRACAGAQHPGLAGRFRFAGGTTLTLVVMHTKSGRTAQDKQLRAQSFAALESAYRRIDDGSGDVVFLGDFNTDGCADCDPGITSQQELDELAEIAAGTDPPLRLLPADVPCTYGGEEGFRSLDHVLVPFHMQAAAHSRVEVHGICREQRCTGDPTLLRAQAVLSDHCPLVVAFDAR
jgi:endonuclease/exonuclease/phosphatase family metal-dependent hydrolase